MGSGKTTVSRRLAKRLPLAAHIETDSIQNLIVSGGLHLHEEPGAEVEHQPHLRQRNVVLLADRFFEAGVTPIIDEALVYASAVQNYITLIHGRPLALVLLAPPPEVSLGSITGQRRGPARQAGWSYLGAPGRRDA